MHRLSRPTATPCGGPLVVAKAGRTSAARTWTALLLATGWWIDRRHLFTPMTACNASCRTQPTSIAASVPWCRGGQRVKLTAMEKTTYPPNSYSPTQPDVDASVEASLWQPPSASSGATSAAAQQWEAPSNGKRLVPAVVIGVAVAALIDRTPVNEGHRKLGACVHHTGAARMCPRFLRTHVSLFR